MELAPRLGSQLDVEALAEFDDHETPSMCGRRVTVPLLDLFVAQLSLK